MVHLPVAAHVSLAHAAVLAVHLQGVDHLTDPAVREVLHLVDSRGLTDD